MYTCILYPRSQETMKHKFKPGDLVIIYPGRLIAEWGMILDLSISTGSAYYDPDTKTANVYILRDFEEPMLYDSKFSTKRKIVTRPLTDMVHATITMVNTCVAISLSEREPEQ